MPNAEIIDNSFCNSNIINQRIICNYETGVAKLPIQVAVLPQLKYFETQDTRELVTYSNRKKCYRYTESNNYLTI